MLDVAKRTVIGGAALVGVAHVIAPTTLALSALGVTTIIFMVLRRRRRLATALV